MSAPTVSPSFFVSSDVPTPFNFYFSPSPSLIAYYNTLLPTPPPYPINSGTPQNPNQVPILRFVIYLACTVMILAFILYLNQRNPPSTQATTPAATAANNDTSQNQVNLVKSMNPEERKEYVTNFLKTQKFVENQKHATASATSSSFRVTQSSSRHLTIGNDIDVESNLADTDINIDDDDTGVMSQKAYPNCAICLERFHDGEDVCSAQNKECPHEFHLDCLFPWLLKSQDCPCCRRDYLSIEPPSPTETTAASPATN